MYKLTDRLAIVILLLIYGLSTVLDCLFSRLLTLEFIHMLVTGQVIQSDRWSTYSTHLKETPDQFKSRQEELDGDSTHSLYIDAICNRGVGGGRKEGGGGVADLVFGISHHNILH